MVGKVLFGAITCIYSLSMIMLLFFSEDNLTINWYNNITDHDGSRTVVSTVHDTTLEDFIQSSCMVTLTVLIFTVLSLNQIYRARQTDLIYVSTRNSNGHYLVMFLIWFLLSLMIFGSLFNYSPDQVAPYQKSYFQKQDSDCNLYYIENSTIYSNETCYTILPKLNITNNYVCCLDIQPIKFIIDFSYSPMLQILCIGFYPIWLLISYFIIINERRTDGYVAINTHH
jgi:hypothetical protein